MKSGISGFAGTENKQQKQMIGNGKNALNEGDSGHTWQNHLIFGWINIVFDQPSLKKIRKKTKLTPL